MPTTTQAPITINNLINKLKLLPGDWKIMVSNSNGEFYIQDITAIDEEELCILNLTLIPV